MSERPESTPVALYARVSSDRQDVDLSVAAQLRALRDHAEKNGHVVVREYVDEAESGWVDDRPQFNKMIEEARSPDAAFREILVWKFSRFTRKREHAVAYKSMLRKRGVRVVSITENADDTPTGKLLEGIIESVDEFYSENLAQEVRRGLVWGARPCGIPSPYCSEERDPKGGFVFYNSFYNASTHEIVDDETIKIEFDNPTIGLGQMDLTTNRGQSGIYPMQEIKAVGWEEWLKDPILSGPYRQTKSVPGERKEFEVNVDWWKKPAPDFEKQILMQVPEAATRLAMVASKQADIITLSALTLNQALQLDHVKILQQPATIHMQFYFFNMLNQDDKGYDPDNPFYDVRVREAFNIAVNREALVNTIYAGLSEVQNAPMMATGMRGWDHPIVVEMRNNPIPFDPSRARQLLKEAGFPKDRKVRILASTSSASGAPEIKELTEAVFTMLRQNLDLDIELVLSASVGEERKLQRYEEDKPSMPWDLAAFFRNSTEPIITPRASYLYSRSMSMFLTDPTWSQMLEIDEVLTSTSDPAAFDEASAKMSKLVRDCWCMIPFTLNPLFWAVNKDRVEDWPLTVGAPWPHYFEYIKAAPQVRQ